MEQKEPPADRPSTTPTGNAAGASESSAIVTRRFLIRFAIAATAASFIGMTAMLYYFWWKRPTGAATLMVVMADQRFDGAIIRIQGPPDISRTLDEKGNYVARFMLPPGNYLVELEQRGRILFRQDLVQLRENVPVRFDLTKMPDEALGGSTVRKPTAPR